MTEKEFKKKWGAHRDTDSMDESTLLEFKTDCFAMYEEVGFCNTFHTTCEDLREFNGMKFEVIGRADTKDFDLETLPAWHIKFANGEDHFAFPNEICKVDAIDI